MSALCECGHMKDQHEQGIGDCKGGHCGCYRFSVAQTFMFTDEDLTRLKNMLEPKGVEAIVGWRVDEWRGLVARLEAAEHPDRRREHEHREFHICERCLADFVWRMAAGK